MQLLVLSSLFLSRTQYEGYVPRWECRYLQIILRVWTNAKRWFAHLIVEYRIPKAVYIKSPYIYLLTHTTLHLLWTATSSAVWEALC